MKVLIIRLSSIGDIVLTSPVIRCVKKTHPTCVLHVLVKPSYHALFEANPYVDAIHHYEARTSLVQKLKREKFDFVIDLQNNARTAYLRWRLGVRSGIVHKVNLEKWLLVNFKINLLPIAHVVDRYMNAARGIGVRNDGLGLDYFIPPDQEVHVDQLPLTHLNGYAALVIGGHHATKRLPLHKLNALVAQLPLPIVTLGGPEDQPLGEVLHQRYPLKVFNACGKFTIHQSASLLKRALVVITHDTGLMHIAAAFRKKIVSLWGNTVPAFGMTPYFGSSAPAAHNHIVEVQGLGCRPCSKLGFTQCPRGHFRCMNDMDIGRVVTLAMT